MNTTADYGRYPTIEMIPYISEHDSWISLDPILGCPVNCAYCFVRELGKTHVKPEIRVSPEDLRNRLIEYLAQDLDLSRQITPPKPRIVCIGNYTDMILLPETRTYLLEYIKLHHEKLPTVPLVFSSKGVMDEAFVEALDRIGQTVVVFISQSFLTECRENERKIEEGVANSDASCKNLTLLARSKNLRPIHFWRPITSFSVPNEEVASTQLKRVKNAGALASIAVGLKFGKFLLSEFLDESSPFQSEVLHDFNGASPIGESFSSDILNHVLHAAGNLQFPVYLNTSCGVSFALNIPEYLGTHRYPLKTFRCEPSICPPSQRSLCASDSHILSPSEQTTLLSTTAEYLGVPRGILNIDVKQNALSINAKVSQDVQSRLTHLTGFRVKPSVVGQSRQWLGSFCGVGKDMDQAGLLVYLEDGVLGPQQDKIIDRQKKITAMITPFGPFSGSGREVFSRYYHIRRVTAVALCLANGIGTFSEGVSIPSVRLLGWLHDLDRWAFSYISESCGYKRKSNFLKYFVGRGVILNERQENDLKLLIEKNSEKMSLEGRIVFIADLAVNVIEDILLAVTALGLTPKIVPSSVCSRIGLPLEDDKFIRTLGKIRRVFELNQSKTEFLDLFDQIVTGFAINLICSKSPSGFDEAYFNMLEKSLLAVKREFLEAELFPITNEAIGNANFWKEKVILPVINQLGSTSKEIFWNFDDFELVDFAIKQGFVSEREVLNNYPDLDYIEHHRPDLIFAP